MVTKFYLITMLVSLLTCLILRLVREFIVRPYAVNIRNRNLDDLRQDLNTMRKHIYNCKK